MGLRICVEIAFLGSVTTIASAFANIFRKMLADNQTALLGLDLIAIEAKRPVVSNRQTPRKVARYRRRAISRRAL